MEKTVKTPEELKGLNKKGIFGLSQRLLREVPTFPTKRDKLAFVLKNVKTDTRQGAGGRLTAPDTFLKPFYEIYDPYAYVDEKGKYTGETVFVKYISNVTPTSKISDKVEMVNYHNVGLTKENGYHIEFNQTKARKEFELLVYLFFHQQNEDNMGKEWHIQCPKYSQYKFHSRDYTKERSDNVDKNMERMDVIREISLWDYPTIELVHKWKHPDQNAEYVYLEKEFDRERYMMADFMQDLNGDPHALDEWKESGRIAFFEKVDKYIEQGLIIFDEKEYEWKEKQNGIRIYKATEGIEPPVIQFYKEQSMSEVLRNHLKRLDAALATLGAVGKKK